MLTGTFRGFEAELHAPGIAVLTFNQPDRLNGMTQPFKRDLIEVLMQAQMDDTVRVVVVTGSGRAFSAGDDITGRPADYGAAEALLPGIPAGHRDPIGTYEGLRWLSQPLNAVVRNLDKLTIAAVNGVAIQTGLSLALACDFRIASTEARLGSATMRFGLMPDEGGQFLLVQLLGVARAMDFLMRSRIVSADEALELGLVHEVVAPDALMYRTMELARELANGPQVACDCSSARSTAPPSKPSRTPSTTSQLRRPSPIITRTPSKACEPFARSARRASTRSAKTAANHRRSHHGLPLLARRRSLSTGGARAHPE